MKPVIFRIPFLGHDVPGYGLMLMAGFLLAIWWATRRAAKSGGNPDVILNCGFIALIAGVVGCRVMYVAHYWDQFAARGGPLDIFFAVIDVRKGGLEFYGGFILASLLVPAWLKFREKVSLRWYMDILAPSAALGLAIGRVGCFLNGCCYGGVCQEPWAVRFPFGSPAQLQQWKAMEPGSELPEQLLYTHSPGISMPLSRDSMRATDAEIAQLDQREAALVQQIAELKQRQASATPEEKQRLAADIRKLDYKRRVLHAKYLDLRANMKKYGMTAAQIEALAAKYRSLPVHPTELYSTITALLLALFLNALYWRRTRDGQAIFTLLAVQPVARYLLEVIRADNPTDTLGIFTISQGLALLLTIVGIAGLIMLRRMSPRSPTAKIWVPESEDGKAPAAEPAAG